MMKPLRKVLICGDRNWTCRTKIHYVLEVEQRTHQDSLLMVVHGGARGADMIADYIAGMMGIQPIQMRALWERNPRAGGPIRNGLMLKANPDLKVVYGFHDDLASSTGTKGMLELSKAARIPTFLVRHDEAIPCTHGWTP